MPLIYYCLPLIIFLSLFYFRRFPRHLFGRKWLLPEFPVTALLLQSSDFVVVLTVKSPISRPFDCYKPKPSSAILFYERWAFHRHPSQAHWPPTSWAVGHASPTIFASALIWIAKKWNGDDGIDGEAYDGVERPCLPPAIPQESGWQLKTPKSLVVGEYLPQLLLSGLQKLNMKNQHGLSLIRSGAWASP